MVRMVDLRQDREHIVSLWRSADGSLVPLPLAAAHVFHEIHEPRQPVVPRPEYEDALNLVAAALSRIVEIYRAGGHAEYGVTVVLQLGAGRFRNAATRYEKHDGEVVELLAVRRQHVVDALPQLKAAAIPFRFT